MGEEEMYAALVCPSLSRTKRPLGKNQNKAHRGSPRTVAELTGNSRLQYWKGRVGLRPVDGKIDTMEILGGSINSSNCRSTATITPREERWERRDTSLLFGGRKGHGENFM